jgi:flavin-binding protein dodecin
VPRRARAGRAARTAPVPAKRRNGAARPAVVRLVESTGSSARGWDAAVVAAVKAADVSAPIGVEVGRLWAELDGGGRLRRYHAMVKVAYRQALKVPAGRRG